VAGGDAVGALSSAADKAAMGLSMIPVVGLPAAAALKTFTSGLVAVRDVMGAFAERGRELGGYNGSIAGAVARQDVTRTLTDIREAQMLGDKYGNLINAQTRFEETLKAGLIPIKGWILEELPKVLDGILNILIKVGELIARNTPGEAANKIIAEMKKMRDGFVDGLDGGDIIKQWLGDGVLGFRIPPGELGPIGGPLAAPVVRDALRLP